MDGNAEAITNLNVLRGTIRSLSPYALDTTLSIEGTGAEAKATGAAIAAVNAALENHTNNTANPHGVTKAQLGIGNIDNTADMDKPVSTAQATAIAEAKKAGTDAQAALGGYVVKVEGKALSTNDFTDAYKTKLDGIEEGATNSGAASSVDTEMLATGAVTAVKIANGAVSTSFTTTIPVDNWSLTSNNEYRIDIAVTGVLDTDEPIVDLDLRNQTAADCVTLKAEWAKCNRIATELETVTAFFGELPEVEIPIRLLAIRK